MPERAYHHGNLRRVLLDAALALFAERGSFDFTLRELARTADVTHAAPYRHFAGKAELLAALREEGAALLFARAERALRKAGEDPRRQVRQLGEAYVRFALEHPHHFRLMLHNPLGGARVQDGERLDAGAKGTFDLLRAAFEQGRASGVMRTDMDARELAVSAWAVVHGLASLLVEGHLPRGKAALERTIANVGALFFEGVGPSEPKRARRPRT